MNQIQNKNKTPEGLIGENSIKTKPDIVNYLSAILSKTYVLSLKTFQCYHMYSSKLRDSNATELIKQHYNQLCVQSNIIKKRITSLGYNDPNPLQITTVSELNFESLQVNDILLELGNDNQENLSYIHSKLKYIRITNDQSTIDALMSQAHLHEKYVEDYLSMLKDNH